MPENVLQEVLMIVGRYKSRQGWLSHWIVLSEKPNIFKYHRGQQDMVLMRKSLVRKNAIREGIMIHCISGGSTRLRRMRNWVQMIKHAPGWQYFDPLISNRQRAEIFQNVLGEQSDLLRPDCDFELPKGAYKNQ